MIRRRDASHPGWQTGRWSPHSCTQPVHTPVTTRDRRPRLGGRAC
ncbi:hypothetical protein HMPREF9154_2964 [Arachnia propionica F0230a]|nr:hypothetical protein HMPREF9154_2964 [Arachnia propionica F0230a]